MQIKGLDLDKISTRSGGVSNDPDQRTREEMEALECEARKLENERQKRDNEDRRKYAQRIFVLISFWLAMSVGILTLSGFGRAYGFFEMSDSVLIALITTTTGSVVGLFVFVAKYFFNTR